ncbi:MAG: tetratricopeptide repeat protein [Bryobacteraceae bacterium]|jgi:tetratricopeptide (TPR) repeat protein
MRARFLLLAAALAAFGASLGSGFHFDDYAIFSDPVLTFPWGWLQVWGWRQTRPLTYFTFWLNYQTGGQDALGYHVLNLLLHLGAVLMAYECLRRLLPERAALVAAALFAVHPLQAEAVNYVWGRSIVLAALLCFAALLCWITGRPWAAVAWFAAALLAKEECAAFPLVLAMLPERPRRRSQIAVMLGLAVAAGARVIYAAAVTPGAPAGLHAGISPWKYLLAQGPVILRYLRLLIVPYGFTVDADIHVPAVWVGVLAWAGIAGLAVFLWRHRRYAWATWLLAGLILLIPSSSVFPAADLSADRRMYLPMLGFAAAAGWLLTRARTAALATVVVVALTGVSMGRTHVWMTEERLWREAVRRAPEKVRPKIQLSRAVPAAEALELLAQARNLAPYDPEVAAETGKILLSEGQAEGAIEEFGRALALDPRDARNFNNRGVALEALGQTAAARQDFERALGIDPGLTEARQNLEKLPPPGR